MLNVTAFDPREHHIRLVGRMRTQDGLDFEYRAILDTGAPITEFSDQFLEAVGILPEINTSIATKPGLQTQKYKKFTVPQVEVCGHSLKDMTVYVSHFEKHWGVDALIGLDFFRKFRVTIDYGVGQIMTEPY